MAELFLWADLSITGEGFVKYEAAITGTPNLMISQFDHDSLPIQSFLKIGSAKYLGPGENLSEHDIAAAIDTLLNDFEARSALSKAGKKALDGRGIERIFNEILKNIFQ
jgi:spore coat polysaccharide biosynthesis predicted glycosyltransferase SpsG